MLLLCLAKSLGAYNAPPDTSAGGEGTGCPLSRTPPPLSALLASLHTPLS